MSRRLARETALQVLYQIDLTGETENVASAIENWANEFAVSAKNLPFLKQLVIGTLENIEVIDDKIKLFAHDWSIDRMSVVDRNLMRLAVYEMLFCPDIPQKVTVNEASDIAKKFGSDDSSKFINGILDKIMAVTEK